MADVVAISAMERDADQTNRMHSNVNYVTKEQKY